MKFSEIIELDKLSILRKDYGCIICRKPDKHLGFLGYCAEHSSSGKPYLVVAPQKKVANRLIKRFMNNKVIKKCSICSICGEPYWDTIGGEYRYGTGNVCSDCIAKADRTLEAEMNKPKQF